MKAYLKAQVKKGNITQYQADAIYKQYKYTPPKSSGGSGGRRSSGSSSGKSSYSYTAKGNSNSSNDSGNKEKTQDDIGIPNGMLQDIGMNRTNEGRTNAIERLLKKKTINEEQAKWLLNHFDLA